jgi:hypothetical protein
LIEGKELIDPVLFSLPLSIVLWALFWLLFPIYPVPIPPPNRLLPNLLLLEFIPTAAPVPLKLDIYNYCDYYISGVIALLFC